MANNCFQLNATASFGNVLYQQVPFCSNEPTDDRISYRCVHRRITARELNAGTRAISPLPHPYGGGSTGSLSRWCVSCRPQTIKQPSEMTEYASKTIIPNFTKDDGDAASGITDPDNYEMICNTIEESFPTSLHYCSHQKIEANPKFPVTRRLPRFCLGANRSYSNVDVHKKCNCVKYPKCECQRLRGYIKMHSPSESLSPSRIQPSDGKRLPSSDNSQISNSIKAARQLHGDSEESTITRSVRNKEIAIETISYENIHGEQALYNIPMRQSLTLDNLSTREKRRDKLRRRKGVYISHWPNLSSANCKLLPADGHNAHIRREEDPAGGTVTIAKPMQFTCENDEADDNIRNSHHCNNNSMSTQNSNVISAQTISSRLSSERGSESEDEMETFKNWPPLHPSSPDNNSACNAAIRPSSEILGMQGNASTALLSLQDPLNQEYEHKHQIVINDFPVEFINNSIDDTLEDVYRRMQMLPILNNNNCGDHLLRRYKSDEKLMMHNELSSVEDCSDDNIFVELSDEPQEASGCVHSESVKDTRTHVVIELYDNEQAYVESLQILVNKYLEPLKRADNTHLDLALVDEIFYEIPVLLQHHQAFLDGLKNRLDHWDIRQKIGDLFIDTFSKSSLMKSYGNYVNNWKRTRDIIKNAQQSKPTFARFLEITERENKGKLSLDSLLIKPVQKIPKYELLLQRLLKHTDPGHPDHCLLKAAQKEIHEQLLKINCIEQETLDLTQLREIEALIEGLFDFVSTDRQYLKFDLVTVVTSSNARKERALFLFSDILLVTRIKRKSSNIKKPSPNVGTIGSGYDANKYKLLLKIPLEDLEIVSSRDDHVERTMNDVEKVSKDIKVLNQINDLSSSLHCDHCQLDYMLKDMLMTLNKQMSEAQNRDSQMDHIDLILNTLNGAENITFIFSDIEKRISWEETFNEITHKLAIVNDQKHCPELVATVPIRKTRAGLQFTCAASTISQNGTDVWVCNSDGYVGQVCILSLQPEPAVISCNGVCNAKILCIESVPGNSSGNNNTEKERSKTIPSDSSSSSSDDESKAEETSMQKKNLTAGIANLGMTDEIDNKQSTVWMGTEDGCIHVFNSSDNIRIKKNKLKLQHGSAVLNIIYLNQRVFISLANGDILVYDRGSSVGWNINAPTTITIGTSSAPVTKMFAHAGKLWCVSGNAITILSTQTLVTEKRWVINNDNNKPVFCICAYGNGLWLSTQNSSIVQCIHTTNFEILCDINVAPAVTKILTSCDDIIRQHKAACLRITALLACKDLLWIGTSAGVLLTMPLPHIALSTTKLAAIPSVNGVSYGHTGHVRFLTFVELKYDSVVPHQDKKSARFAIKEHMKKILIISGGDGYEDFRSSSVSEVAGREDSTNHLLLWSH